MSRIGKVPIVIPSTIDVKFIKAVNDSSAANDSSSVSNSSGSLESSVKGAGDSGIIVISSGKSSLSYEIPDGVSCIKDGNVIKVEKKDKSADISSLVGLARTIIANMVNGLVNGFEKKLVINGVGYKASVNGKFLYLSLGYSTDIVYCIPPEVTIKCEKNEIVISSFDKQKVGQVAAQIRDMRKPEPYKGKGIRYAGEVVRLKKGKR